MFERFTERARRVLVHAQQEARLLQHDFIGTEHIFLGLLSEGEGVAAKALGELGVTLGNAREKVSGTVGPMGESSPENPPFTPRAKKVLELSLREALGLGHNYIGTAHMLLGLVREGEGVAAQVLVQMCGDLTRVRDKVLELLGAGQGEEGPEGAGPEQRLRGLRSEPSAPFSVPRRQRQGEPPYCPGCGKALAGNLQYTRLAAAATKGSAPAAASGEGAPGQPAREPPPGLVAYWVFAYCANCGFPLGAAPGGEEPAPRL